MGNIKRVEKEMNAIDPQLIAQSELVEAAESSNGSHKDAFGGVEEEVGVPVTDTILQEEIIKE